MTRQAILLGCERRLIAAHCEEGNHRLRGRMPTWARQVLVCTSAMSSAT